MFACPQTPEEAEQDARAVAERVHAGGEHVWPKGSILARAYLPLVGDAGSRKEKQAIKEANLICDARREERATPKKATPDTHIPTHPRATHKRSREPSTTTPDDPQTPKTKIRRRCGETVTPVKDYFGGYICKRQKIGKLEARKCIEKMQRLRELHKGKSEYQQQRAVSGRMITGIEMNGTVRGAVEEIHLCTNPRGNDAVFGESMQAFLQLQ